MAANRDKKGERPLKTLERVFSKAGLGSRVDARLWIKSGKVRVNGKIATDPDLWVDLERDRVTLDGAPVRAAARTYLLLYKPNFEKFAGANPEIASAGPVMRQHA